MKRYSNSKDLQRLSLQRRLSLLNNSERSFVHESILTDDSNVRYSTPEPDWWNRIDRNLRYDSEFARPPQPKFCEVNSIRVEQRKHILMINSSDNTVGSDHTFDSNYSFPNTPPSFNLSKHKNNLFGKRNKYASEYGHAQRPSYFSGDNSNLITKNDQYPSMNVLESDKYEFYNRENIEPSSGNKTFAEENTQMTSFKSMLKRSHQDNSATNENNTRMINYKTLRSQSHKENPTLSDSECSDATLCESLDETNKLLKNRKAIFNNKFNADKDQRQLFASAISNSIQESNVENNIKLNQDSMFSASVMNIEPIQVNNNTNNIVSPNGTKNIYPHNNDNSTLNKNYAQIINNETPRKSQKNNGEMTSLSNFDCTEGTFSVSLDETGKLFKKKKTMFSNKLSTDKEERQLFALAISDSINNSLIENVELNGDHTLQTSVLNIESTQVDKTTNENILSLNGPQDIHRQENENYAITLNNTQMVNNETLIRSRRSSGEKLSLLTLESSKATLRKSHDETSKILKKRKIVINNKLTADKEKHQLFSLGISDSINNSNVDNNIDLDEDNTLTSCVMNVESTHVDNNTSNIVSSNGSKNTYPHNDNSTTNKNGTQIISNETSRISRKSNGKQTSFSNFECTEGTLSENLDETRELFKKKKTMFNNKLSANKEEHQLFTLAISDSINNSNIENLELNGDHTLKTSVVNIESTQVDNNTNKNIVSLNEPQDTQQQDYVNSTINLNNTQIVNNEMTRRFRKSSVEKTSLSNIETSKATLYESLDETNKLFTKKKTMFNNQITTDQGECQLFALAISHSTNESNIENDIELNHDNTLSTSVVTIESTHVNDNTNRIVSFNESNDTHQYKEDNSSLNKKDTQKDNNETLKRSQKSIGEKDFLSDFDCSEATLCKGIDETNMKFKKRKTMFDNKNSSDKGEHQLFAFAISASINDSNIENNMEFNTDNKSSTCVVNIDSNQVNQNANNSIVSLNEQKDRHQNEDENSIKKNNSGNANNKMLRGSLEKTLELNRNNTLSTSFVNIQSTQVHDNINNIASLNEQNDTHQREDENFAINKNDIQMIVNNEVLVKSQEGHEEIDLESNRDNTFSTSVVNIELTRFHDNTNNVGSLNEPNGTHQCENENSNLYKNAIQMVNNEMQGRSQDNHKETVLELNPDNTFSTSVMNIELIRVHDNTKNIISLNEQKDIHQHEDENFTINKNNNQMVFNNETLERSQASNEEIAIELNRDRTFSSSVVHIESTHVEGNNNEQKDIPNCVDESSTVKTNDIRMIINNETLERSQECSEEIALDLNRNNTFLASVVNIESTQVNDNTNNIIVSLNQQKNTNQHEAVNSTINKNETQIVNNETLRRSHRSHGEQASSSNLEITKATFCENLDETSKLFNKKRTMFKNKFSADKEKCQLFTSAISNSINNSNIENNTELDENNTLTSVGNIESTQVENNIGKNIVYSNEPKDTSSHNDNKSSINKNGTQILNTEEPRKSQKNHEEKASSSHFVKTIFNNKSNADRGECQVFSSDGSKFIDNNYIVDTELKGDNNLSKSALNIESTRVNDNKNNNVSFNEPNMFSLIDTSNENVSNKVNTNVNISSTYTSNRFSSENSENDDFTVNEPRNYTNNTNVLNKTTLTHRDTQKRPTLFFTSNAQIDNLQSSIISIDNNTDYSLNITSNDSENIPILESHESYDESDLTYKNDVKKYHETAVQSAELHRKRVDAVVYDLLYTSKYNACLNINNKKLLDSDNVFKKPRPVQFVKRSTKITTNEKINLMNKQKKLYSKEGWITPRLYKFIQDKLESKYGIKTRMRSERFVKELAYIVNTVIKSKENYNIHIEKLKREMARLNLINTTNDYFCFIRDFLPISFRLKSIPACERNVPDVIGNIYEPII